MTTKYKTAKNVLTSGSNAIGTSYHRVSRIQVKNFWTIEFFRAGQ
jgi:hypothetical protein